MKNRREPGPLRDRKKKIDEIAYVVIDTELTGLDARKDSIVSVGAVKMTGRRIEIGSSFYRLVKPRTALTAESVLIHEITPSEVQDKPDIRSVLSEFLDYCGDDVIVGYCTAIDIEFLDREARRALGRKIENPVLDIQAIQTWMSLWSRWEISYPNDWRLYDIARYFGIALNGAHTAIIDAYLAAQIFQRFIPRLIGAEISCLGDLIQLSDKYKGGDRHTFDRSIFFH